MRNSSCFSSWKSEKHCFFSFFEKCYRPLSAPPFTLTHTQHTCDIQTCWLQEEKMWICLSCRWLIYSLQLLFRFVFQPKVFRFQDSSVDLIQNLKSVILYENLGKIQKTFFHAFFCKTLVGGLAQWLVVKFLWLYMRKLKYFQRATADAWKHHLC